MVELLVRHRDVFADHLVGKLGDEHRQRHRANVEVVLSPPPHVLHVLLVLQERDTAGGRGLRLVGVVVCGARGCLVRRAAPWARERAAGALASHAAWLALALGLFRRLREADRALLPRSVLGDLGQQAEHAYQLLRQARAPGEQVALDIFAARLDAVLAQVHLLVALQLVPLEEERRAHQDGPDEAGHEGHDRRGFGQVEVGERVGRQHGRELRSDGLQQHADLRAARVARRREASVVAHRRRVASAVIVAPSFQAAAVADPRRAVLDAVDARVADVLPVALLQQAQRVVVLRGGRGVRAEVVRYVPPVVLVLVHVVHPLLLFHPLLAVARHQHAARCRGLCRGLCRGRRRRGDRGGRRGGSGGRTDVAHVVAAVRHVRVGERRDVAVRALHVGVAFEEPARRQRQVVAALVVFDRGEVEVLLRGVLQRDVVQRDALADGHVRRRAAERSHRRDHVGRGLCPGHRGRLQAPPPGLGHLGRGHRAQPQQRALDVRRPRVRVAPVVGGGHLRVAAWEVA